MQMHSLAFDISHTLAGGLVLISFMMLYQDRLYSLLNVFALHAVVLALSVAWQAFIQDAPHLYITAVIALVFKAIVIPVALHRIVKQLGIHRDIESAVGIGPTMQLRTPRIDRDVDGRGIFDETARCTTSPSIRKSVVREPARSSGPFQSSRRRRFGLLDILHPRLRHVLPETNATSPG